MKAANSSYAPPVKTTARKKHGLPPRDVRDRLEAAAQRVGAAARRARQYPDDPAYRVALVSRQREYDTLRFALTGSANTPPRR